MSHDDPNDNPNDEELNMEHVENQDDHEQDPNPDSSTTPLCSVKNAPEDFPEKDVEENQEDGTNDQTEEEIEAVDNDKREHDQEEHEDEVKGTTIIIETDLTPEPEAKSEHPEEEPEQEEIDEVTETTSTEETEPKFEEPMFNEEDLTPETPANSEVPEEETDEIPETLTKEETKPLAKETISNEEDLILETSAKIEALNEDLAEEESDEIMETGTKEDSEPLFEQPIIIENFSKDLMTPESTEADHAQEDSPDTEKNNEVTIEVVEVEHENMGRTHEESKQSLSSIEESSQNAPQNDSVDENEPSLDVPTLVKIFESSFSESNQQMVSSPKKGSNDTQATAWVFESERLDDGNEQEIIIGSNEQLTSEAGNDNTSTEPDEMKLPLMEIDSNFPDKDDHNDVFNGKPEKLESTEVTDSNQVRTFFFFDHFFNVGPP